MKKRVWVLVFALAVLATACMIFAFSAQDGADSSETSGRIAWAVMRLFHPEYDSLDALEQARLFSAYQHAVRKTAHFCEFALLGCFLYLLFFALGYRWQSRWKAPLAWLAGTLYACSDEWHQMYVGARAASWQDVGIDSAGVLFGVLAAGAVLFLSQRLRGRR